MDTGSWACLCNLVYAKMSKILDKFKILVKLQKHQRKFGIFAQDFYSSENRYLCLEIPKETLPKALRTQALTALTSSFCLVW